MENQLSSEELVQLVHSVFQPGPEDKNIGILIDLPDTTVPDTPAWKIRRTLAVQWTEILNGAKKQLGLEQVFAVFYGNVHNNNADLPGTFFTGSHVPDSMDIHTVENQCESVTADRLFSETRIFMAPTQFSATAPLKVLAKKYGFRAATMPGFSGQMIPALRIDYSEVNKRVLELKTILDPSTAVKIVWIANGETIEAVFDIRFRQAHASGGRFPDPGTAGNLPSGECYIVPYEGELNTPSGSQGVLPVQFGDEVVLYRIEENKAVDILSDGTVSDRERRKIKEEPAYANIAEIGFGILEDFGLSPIGEILLDEKLGLHIAFGRSDHFGGAVGPEDFTSPDAVCHLDRIYLPQIQSGIHVQSVEIMDPSGPSRQIMRNGKYTIFKQKLE